MLSRIPRYLELKPVSLGSAYWFSVIAQYYSELSYMSRIFDQEGVDSLNDYRKLYAWSNCRDDVRWLEEYPIASHDVQLWPNTFRSLNEKKSNTEIYNRLLILYSVNKYIEQTPRTLIVYNVFVENSEIWHHLRYLEPPLSRTIFCFPWERSR